MKLDSDTLYRAKGIGILLMVIGHSLLPTSEIHRFIYLFHMPLFYILSGMLFKTKHIKNAFQFIKRKLKTLYLPFLKYSLVFLLLHNIFFKTGLIVGEEYSLKLFLSNLFLNLRFVGTEELCGALWFLRSLFFVNIIFVLLWRILQIVLKCDIQICISIFLLTLIGGCILNYSTIILLYNLGRDIFCVSLFTLGYLFRNLPQKINYESVWIIPLFVFLIILNNHTEIQLHNFNIGNPILSLLAMIAGWLLVLILSSLFTFKTLIYIGKHTVDVLVYHFLAFKIVTLVIIKLYALDSVELNSFPVLYTYPNWWILYSLVGIIIPLLINAFFRKLFVNHA